MSTCRKCGQPLAFKRNENGKMVPTNPDGSDHFDICRQRQFEVVKTKGEPHTRKTALGKGRFMVENGYKLDGRFIKTDWHYEDKHGRTI